jgi:hypothetical protein
LPSPGSAFIEQESLISTYFSFTARHSGGYVDMVPSAIVKTISKTPSPQIRVFALKGFVRFARRINVSEATLWETVLSPPYADLGGGLYKFRIARPGEGARGGGRALAAMRVGCRAILMFGWEKKDMENIGPRELKVYRDLAKRYLDFSNDEISIAVSGGILQEFPQPR